MTTPDPEDKLSRIEEAAREIRRKADELAEATKKIEKRRSWREMLLWIALSASLVGGGLIVERDNQTQNQRIEQIEKRVQPVRDSELQSGASALEAKLDKLAQIAASASEISPESVQLTQSIIDDLKSLSKKTCTPELREEAERIYSDLEAILATKALDRERITRAELKLRKHLLNVLKLCAPGG